MKAPSLPTVFAVLFGLFVLVQLVPYGRDHTNPPDGAVVAWDSPATKALVERACFDCHSNHTNWPGYSSVAPISWLIQDHVFEGREKLNFTAFDPGNEKVAEHAGEAGESVTEGEMPPWDYAMMHPEARLTVAEKQALVAGLDTTFAAYRKAGEGGSGEAGEGGEKGEDRD
jgi:mono/diheme cytochrome c family protein